MRPSCARSATSHHQRRSDSDSLKMKARSVAERKLIRYSHLSESGTLSPTGSAIMEANLLQYSFFFCLSILSHSFSSRRASTVSGGAGIGVPGEDDPARLKPLNPHFFFSLSLLLLPSASTWEGLRLWGAGGERCHLRPRKKKGMPRTGAGGR